MEGVELEGEHDAGEGGEGPGQHWRGRGGGGAIEGGEVGEVVGGGGEVEEQVVGLLRGEGAVGAEAEVLEGGQGGHQGGRQGAEVLLARGEMA